MEPADLKRFTATLRSCYELYSREVSPGVISLWWESMRPYSLEAFTLAMSRHVQNPDTGQFLPKPADVIRMLGGTTQDKALLAWAKVDRAIRHVGTYESVAFDDPLIHRVLHDMCGWIGLGTKSEEEWPFVQREFENRYRGYSIRNEKPEYPGRLIGITEADNSLRGRRCDPPRLIGNAEMATAVLTGGTDRALVGFTVALSAAAKPAQRRLEKSHVGGA